MARFSIVAWLKRITGRCRPPARRLVRVRKPPCLPQLLPLEDRTLPSTFLVTSLADSGPGSLRQAVLNANAHSGADTILFATGLQGTIKLTSGELDVTDSVKILGPGTGKLTISGNNASRVFNLTGSGTSVEIDDLTIAHGSATTTTSSLLGNDSVTLGGGIAEIGGQLTLKGDVLTSNQAGGLLSSGGSQVVGGGALAAIGGARVQIQDCLFIDNRADGQSISAGGAIAVDASAMTVQTSTFDTNVAHALLGGSANNLLQGSASGGAIGSTGGSQVVLSQDLFRGNQAVGGSGTNGSDGQNGGNAGFGGFGGAILSTDNSVFVSAATGASLTIDHGTFLSNLAQGGSGGAGSAGQQGGSGGFGQGGAIHTSSDTGGSSALIITNSLFADNQAVGGAGGNGGVGGAGGDSTGGAINGDSTALAIASTKFLSNQSVGGAGGGSGAGAQGGSGGVGSGGALSSIPGSLTPHLPPALALNTVLVQGNLARGGAGGTGSTGGNGGMALGGGIESEAGTLNVSSGNVYANAAIGGASGGAGGTGGPVKGGGVANLLGSTAVIVNTFIQANTAEGGGGGTRGAGGIALGGGLENDATSKTTFTHSSVFSNQALAGIGLMGNGGYGFGGGVANETGGIVIRDRSTVLFSNQASTSSNDVFGVVKVQS